MRAKFMSTILFASFGAAASAGVITVNTSDNAALPGGDETSLYEALLIANPGDTIAFAIPGPGPHLIQTPLGGYPLITVDNLTIDGYTQPGAAPNTNSILAGNNAVIQIVLDSRAADSAPNDPADATLLAKRSTRLLFGGFGNTESAILGVKAAQNFHVRGLSFLSRHVARGEDGNPDDPDVYCVAFANNPDQAVGGGHVSGCWFGLHPDGVTVAGGRSSVASFRNGTTATNLTIGTDGDGSGDRGEFNLHLGMAIAINLQVDSSKCSGNYVNVFPDGKTFLDVNALAAEVGRAADPTNPDAGPETIEFYENADATSAIIGTDGDGVSDADERNIVGCVSYPRTIEFWHAANRVVIAGNYFGVGVDGVTRSPVSTNEAPDFLYMTRNPSNVRIGSNGDGAHDELEGNLIVGGTGRRFFYPDTVFGNQTLIAARRNTILDCAYAAVPFANADVAYGSYYSFSVADPSTAVPVLAPITNQVMRGSFGLPNASTFPFVMLDVYRVDSTPLDRQPLPVIDPVAWLGSIIVTNPSENGFAFDLSPAHLKETDYVAVAATYSMDLGVCNSGRAVSSPLSNPVSIKPRLSLAWHPDGSVDLSWIAPEGAFQPQINSPVDDPTYWGDSFDLPTYSYGRNILSLPPNSFESVQLFRLRSQ